MTEKLLQYIWQFQYFNQSGLCTTKGEPLYILSPGMINKDQGPDFLNARIRIGSTMLAGSVELHLKTSLWDQHGHQEDANYKNVILHVVYHHDLQDHPLPVLELYSLVPRMLLERYTGLMGSPSLIACAHAIASVNELTWNSWKERLLAERLTRKTEAVFKSLKENGMHWEESFWWLLARNFGVKVNADSFERIARSIPLNVLARHKNQMQQVEGILFGQAGMLDHSFNEDYPRLLQREYRFLKNKWKLVQVPVPLHFLRMRPGNFPSVRLAQLAAIVQSSTRLFSKIIEIESADDLRALFDVTANDYWHYHYRFDEPTSFKKKKLGMDMINNILINTVVPVVFAYGLHCNEEKYKTRAIKWLEEVDAETNAIVKGFTSLSIPCKNAYDSQSLIELKTRYCDNRYCLQCALGNAILKST